MCFAFIDGRAGGNHALVCDLLQVWDKNQFVKSISVKDQLKKKHGVIHDDGEVIGKRGTPE